MDKMMLNATTKGNILDKDATEAFKLIEETTLGGQSWNSDVDYDWTTGKSELDAITKLKAELAALRHNVNQSKKVVASTSHS